MATTTGVRRRIRLLKPPISQYRYFRTNTTFLARYGPASKAMLTLIWPAGCGFRKTADRLSEWKPRHPRSGSALATFATITLTGDVQTVPGFQLQSDATRFFRAVLITP